MSALGHSFQGCCGFPRHYKFIPANIHGAETTENGPRLKTILPEDLIGLKIQAISNDPRNQFPVDAPDIQRIFQIKISEIDMEVVKMYFELFSKEDLLDGWLDEINR